MADGSESAYQRYFLLYSQSRHMSLTDGMHSHGLVGCRSHGGTPLAESGRTGMDGGVCGTASLRRRVTIVGAWAGIGQLRGYLAVAMRVRRGCF